MALLRLRQPAPEGSGAENLRSRLHQSDLRILPMSNQLKRRHLTRRSTVMIHAYPHPDVVFSQRGSVLVSGSARSVVVVASAAERLSHLAET